MDYSIVGKYKDHEVYLIEEDDKWFIAFDHIAHRYWLSALNSIAKENPEYSFETQDGVVVVIKELAPLLERINLLVESLA